ncbi:MAG: alpha/beta fold hydrolase [Alphaproteobacteria bacterium]
MKIESFNFLDESRDRLIPVALYFHEERKHTKKIPVVLLNHGSGSFYTRYSYLADFLAYKGYAVISIQHDLIEDEPITLPKFNEGIVKEIRKPIWEMWIANMSYVIKEFKKIMPDFDLDRLTLLGHSTGGDVIMYFAEKYPDMVADLISLDGLRCPFPRNIKSRVLMFLANDTITDQGVIPNNNEKHQLDIQTVKLNAKHREYSDRGSDNIKQEVISIVGKFLHL